MEKIPSFNQYIEDSVIKFWDKDAFTDYKGATLQYHDVARKIEKLHIMFENSGVKRGDKIALCGRNSSHWAVAFLATLTYGAIAVPVQNEFTPEQIHNIVNHSESKLLFVGDVVCTQVNPDMMPALEGIVYLPDFSIVISRSEQLTFAREHLNEIFGKRYPKYFRKEHISYYKEQSPEELAMINYTSGTTGFSKGVMLPYRALWGNLDYVLKCLSPNVKPGSNLVSILPMAHMYGLAVEFLFGFINGCHLYFLNRMPSPSLIAEAFAEVKPRLIVAVPLVVEKIIRRKVLAEVQTNRMKLLLNMPIINKKIKQHIRDRIMEAFGGNAYEIIVGGAPLNQGIEEFLNSVGVPITIGYGTTETAPLITFANYDKYKIASCGPAVEHMEVKVVSPDPANVPGELIAKGMNVMLGYYKNEEATNAVLDKDGWFHTGDLATMAPSGHIYIKGRIKNMLLGANGQNVYPEEIEDKLNNMPLVGESIIIQRDTKLIALVHPEIEDKEAMDFDDDDVKGIMDENLKTLNNQLPPFCKIAAIEIQKEEFQKTAKKSIKRYLYK
ncbi:MAG: AMP-binding protein [Prevotella sp.]|uniref:AMP-binding protein n=1 Tax=Leyella stercorea TaxID=363265 RepID=UPI001F2A71F6|nr:MULTISPECIES: AMP-binding protein [Prevotellaceae]MCF2577652.1 AMP-binding protein [Leyella stercorea]MCI7184398.1 AMP-binding protein [Prevotella sp.]